MYMNDIGQFRPLFYRPISYRLHILIWTNDHVIILPPPECTIKKVNLVGLFNVVL